jgi:hypothetical protein
VTDATLPAELAGTVVGRRLTWFLDRLRDGAAGLTDEDVSATWVSDPPAAPAVIRRGMCAHFAAAIGPFVVLSFEPWRADFALVMLEDERRRAWRAWVQLEPAPPHRIRIAASVLTPPSGITLRTAGPDDATALRALERRCPIVMGDVRITYDRGADYFAGARLIGDAYPMVAEQDGRLIAMHCMVTHDVRVGHLLCGATYLHHSRIAPEAQRGGLFSSLNGAEVERNAEKSELLYSYVAVGNTAALRVVPVPPWSLCPERLVLDCRAQAGAPFGRNACADDAERVVELINAAHHREELFVPYTIERLAARLGREPALYGWPHLLLSERAVVGVWPAGLRILREAPDGREESVRALVIDTGFTSGAEGELVALVRAWCATLAEQGFTHLTLFTSPGSPGRDALQPLAVRIEPYHLNIGVPEPPDVAARGIYVDHLYF